MKTTIVREREIEAVSLRSAWLISRACEPGCTSPISPSSSERGTSAATEIDHQHIDCAGTHQSVGDFQRLLAGIGLGDQQVIDIHAELAGIGHVQRMFGVDEGADAALLLRFRNGVQRKRGFARRFRSIDLNYATARETANAKRYIEPQRARGNGFDIHGFVVLAKLHDRALAELTLDLAQRSRKGFRFIHGRSFNETQGRLTHDVALLMAGIRPPDNAAPLHRRNRLKSAMYAICSLFAICSF